MPSNVCLEGGFVFFLLNILHKLFICSSHWLMLILAFGLYFLGVAPTHISGTVPQLIIISGAHV